MIKFPLFAIHNSTRSFLGLTMFSLPSHCLLFLALETNPFVGLFSFDGNNFIHIGSDVSWFKLKAAEYYPSLLL